MIKKIVIIAISTILSSGMIADDKIGNIIQKNVEICKKNKSKLFIKEMLLNNNSIKEVRSLERVKTIFSGYKCWTKDIYKFTVELYDGSIQSSFTSIVSDGEMFSNGIFNKNKTDIFTNKISVSSFFDEKRLVYKAKNPKYNVVVFGDFQCPYCVNTVSKLIETVLDKNDINLYYYNSPLSSIHPVSEKISLCVLSAMKKYPHKKIDILKSSYSNSLSSTSSNMTISEVVVFFNKQTKYNFPITVNDVSDSNIKNRLDKDIEITISNGIDHIPYVLNEKIRNEKYD